MWFFQFEYQEILSVLFRLYTCPYDQWTVHSMEGYLLQISIYLFFSQI